MSWRSLNNQHSSPVENPLGMVIVGKPAKTAGPLQHQWEAYIKSTSSTSENQSSTTADIAQLDHENQQTTTLHTAIDSLLQKPEVSAKTKIHQSLGLINLHPHWVKKLPIAIIFVMDVEAHPSNISGINVLNVQTLIYAWIASTQDPKLKAVIGKTFINFPPNQ